MVCVHVPEIILCFPLSIQAFETLARQILRKVYIYTSHCMCTVAVMMDCVWDSEMCSFPCPDRGMFVYIYTIQYPHSIPILYMLVSIPFLQSPSQSRESEGKSVDLKTPPARKNGNSGGGGGGGGCCK